MRTYEPRADADFGPFDPRPDTWDDARELARLLLPAMPRDGLADELAMALMR